MPRPVPQVRLRLSPPHAFNASSLPLTLTARLLTPAMLAELAASGRFWFHKDTSRDNAVIRSKLEAVAGTATPFRLFNGNVATLYPSLLDGATGFSGISGEWASLCLWLRACPPPLPPANFYPWLHVWLVENFRAEEAKAVKVHTFLAVAENTLKDLYPLSAKVYQHLFHGRGPSSSRAVTASLNAEQMLKLRCVHDMMLDVCGSVGIEVDPATM